MAQSGDRCPQCGGWILVERSIIVTRLRGPAPRNSRGQFMPRAKSGPIRVRYLRCTTPRCGFKPPGGPQVIELPRFQENFQAPAFGSA